MSDIGLKKDDFIETDQIIKLGYSPNRIDLLTGISGITFNEAYKNKVKGKIGSEDVYFISAHHLLKNKMSTGRTKDITDAEILKKFLG